MGRGNALPHDCHDFKGWYLDYEAIYGEDYWEKPEHEYDYKYDDFKEELVDFFAEHCPSFYVPDKRCWQGNEGFVLLHSEYCSLVLSDNESSVAIHISIPYYREVPENRMALAYRHMEIAAKKLLEFLKPYGENVYVRTSAWTSAQVFPKEKTETV